MNALFADGIILPVLVLVALGWCVPQLLAKVMPEGVGPLFMLAGLSFVILLLLSAILFAVMYVWRGQDIATLWSLAGLFVFGRGALLSGLIWLPVMIISVANLPRRWTKEVW